MTGATGMVPITKILVPVDFSGPSRKAVTYALTLARGFGAQMIVAHVVPESSALTYAFPTQVTRIEEEQFERATREIHELVPAEYTAKLHPQFVVKIGRIADELLGLVGEFGVDLVVMGTHGRRHLGRWFIGSVTEHLLRKLPVPVLTVSHVDDKHVIGTVPLKRILYAADLSESSLAGLKYAIELALGTGSELRVTHVVDDDDRILWGPALFTRLAGERARLVEDARKRLDDYLGQVDAQGVSIEPLVFEGKPYEKILEFAEADAADIIVLNLQSRTSLDRALLGSTAERVVRLSRIPVLSIPVARNA